MRAESLCNAAIDFASGEGVLSLCNCAANTLAIGVACRRVGGDADGDGFGASAVEEDEEAAAESDCIGGVVLLNIKAARRLSARGVVVTLLWDFAVDVMDLEPSPSPMRAVRKLSARGVVVMLDDLIADVTLLQLFSPMSAARRLVETGVAILQLEPGARLGVSMMES